MVRFFFQEVIKAVAELVALGDPAAFSDQVVPARVRKFTLALNEQGNWIGKQRHCGKAQKLMPFGGVLE